VVAGRQWEVAREGGTQPPPSTGPNTINMGIDGPEASANILAGMIFLGGGSSDKGKQENIKLGGSTRSRPNRPCPAH